MTGMQIASVVVAVVGVVLILLSLRFLEDDGPSLPLITLGFVCVFAEAAIWPIAWMSS